MKIHIYSDPGHAWAKVPHKTLNLYRVQHKISSCSYQRGDYAYLEEDCDLNLFVQAVKDHGESVSFIEHHTDKQSKIRNYESYSKIDFLTVA